MRVTLFKEARMRGDDRQQGAMYRYISPEARGPHDHPLRAIRGLVDDVLRELSSRFAGLYARVGRPSIPPEQLLRAQLLQILYTIRSERQLMEQLDYNLLFRWFVGLNMDDPVWDPTVFIKNRQRLLEGEVATAFLERVVALAQQRGLLSGEHFTVDGTLIEAWASLKSFKRKDGEPPAPDDPGNPAVDFHGERRSNVTHTSMTAPDARSAKRGTAANGAGTGCLPLPRPSTTSCGSGTSPPTRRDRSAEDTANEIAEPSRPSRDASRLPSLLRVDTDDSRFFTQFSRNLLERGDEGIVAKDQESRYVPGAPAQVAEGETEGLPKEERGCYRE
jgi:transposase